MSDLNKLLEISDKLDEGGLSIYADFLDQHIEKIAKQQKHKSGLKEETINNHIKLYEDYKKTMEDYEKEFNKAINSKNEKDSSNSGKLRDITSNYSYNCNATRLHEMYFEDIINSKPYSAEKDKQIIDVFKELYNGGFSKFESELERLVLIPRNGWVVLNFCFVTKKLYLNTIDLHDQHVIACAIPVLAIDLWEHAYINDFGLDKIAYLKWVNDNIDWRNIRKRIKGLSRFK